MNPASPGIKTSTAVWVWRGVGLIGCLLMIRWLLVRYEGLIRAHSPGCVFHQLTGWHCPGCGATRATFAMLNGDFGTAWRMNPLFLILLICGLFTVAAAIFGKSHRSPLWRANVKNRGLWTLLAAAVVFGLLRNIPHWPFTLLAPH
jgi:hypothetical protein